MKEKVYQIKLSQTQVDLLLGLLKEQSIIVETLIDSLKNDLEEVKE